MQQVLRNREHFEAWHNEYKSAIDDLAPMAERRILQNHALILGFYRLFCSCFYINEDPEFVIFIAGLGRKRISSAIRQTTIADHFFELLETIDKDKIGHIYHTDIEKIVFSSTYLEPKTSSAIKVLVFRQMNSYTKHYKSTLHISGMD